MSSLESRIRPVSDLPQHEKVLLYGRSGTGKTTILASYPKKLLVLDPGEKGTESIANTDGIDYLPIETWSDLEEAYWFLHSNPDRYATVAIDTMTRLQDLAIQEEQKGGDRLNKMQWGNVSTLLKTWIINFRNLPMHVVFTAQDKESEVEDLEEDGTMLPDVGPAVMPSVAKSLLASVSVVGCTFLREREVQAKDSKGQTVQTTKAEYCLRLGPHARYATKFRVDKTKIVKVPKLLVDPTYSKLLELRQAVNENKESK